MAKAEISPQENGMFSCTHEECSGTFIMKKPSFGLDLEVQRKVGLLAGATPTMAGQDYAEYASVISSGMKESPDGFDIDKIIDVQGLIIPLYEEVVKYWDSFRTIKITPF